jgi:prohibitin 2
VRALVSGWGMRACLSRGPIRAADLQMVDLTLRVLTRPDPSALPTIYRRLGLNYDDKVLPSIVNEVVKQVRVLTPHGSPLVVHSVSCVRPPPPSPFNRWSAQVVAQFNATALLTQRETVSRNIKQLLQDRAKEFNIILEDVSITDLKFGKEFEKAVESKQVAQQDAERARFIVEKALQDKQAIVIRAQGEARSVELIGRAANPGFIQLRRIDAARQIAQSIAASQNTVYLPSESLLLSMANSLYGPDGLADSEGGNAGPLGGPSSADRSGAAGRAEPESKSWW